MVPRGNNLTGSHSQRVRFSLDHHALVTLYGLDGMADDKYSDHVFIMLSTNMALTSSEKSI